MAFTNFIFILSVVSVRGNKIGVVHAERVKGHEIGAAHAERILSSGASHSEVRQQLSDLLKGKSAKDVLEMRRELSKRQQQSSKHPKCPAGFGSQMPDGCCASKWADDYAEVKFQCQDSTKEQGKSLWKVQRGGAHSKFTCCPKKGKDEATFVNLDDGLDESGDDDFSLSDFQTSPKNQVNTMVNAREKERKKPHIKKELDVDWRKEEDMTEAELNNQLALDRKKMHSRGKLSHKDEYFINHVKDEYTTPSDLDVIDQEMELDRQITQMNQLPETSMYGSRDDASGSLKESFFDLFMIVRLIGMGVAVLFFLIWGPNKLTLLGLGMVDLEPLKERCRGFLFQLDLGRIEIPGLGSINLLKARDLFLSGKTASSKQDPPSSSCYGGYGCNSESNFEMPVYQSYKPFSSVGEGQALTAAPPPATFGHMAMSSKEDMGL